MLRVLSKAKVDRGLFTNYADLCIEQKLDMDDKTLTFTAKISDIKGIIELEGYIQTDSDEFVIREINKETSGKATIVAQMNVENLEGKIFRTYRIKNATAHDAVTLALAGTGWKVGLYNTDKSRTLRLTRMSSYEILKEIAGLWRVEYVFHSLEKKIDIYDEVGRDRGSYFSDELNLKNLSVQSTSYDLYTELEAYGDDNLTFSDINDGKPYVTNYSYTSKKKRYIWEASGYTVAADLLADAKAKLADMSRPYTSYSADIVDFSKASSKYSFLDFSIGDTVFIIDSSTSTSERQRIIEIKLYPDNPYKNTCVIANKKLTFDQLMQKYNATTKTVDNITKDNGTVRGSAVDGIATDQILEFDSGIQNSSVIQGINENITGNTNSITALEGNFGELNATVGNFTELYANDIEAINGKFDKLETEDLTAINGYIETLTADSASIKNLYAEQARVISLQADDITALTAKIGEIETGSLKAATADIDALKANYANIKTLLSGNISSGDVTTIVLNSDNATIDTSFLKDVLAQHITVNDLLSGKISTSKFQVGSDSGNLLIDDNTLTIKDNNGNTRIQFGLDAKNDYSIVIYDATGQGQLFNSTGITESGISDGLIKDSKIAGDAGIQATKLDISSLFTAINNAEYTLKGTKIYLDEQGQSLDLAFTEMSSNVSKANDNAQNAVAAANNALKVLSGISTLDALGMSLTNDAHVVHTNPDGSGGNWTECFTYPHVFLGETDVTAHAVITYTTSNGLTGTWNDATKKYQVTGMTTDNGYVDFSVVYGASSHALTRNGIGLTTRSGKLLTIKSEGAHLSKRFSVSKAPDGKTGMSYDLQASVMAITRKPLGENDAFEFSPSSVTFKLVKNDNGILTEESAIFVIEETLDFETYMIRYTSTSPEMSIRFTPTKSSKIKAVRCTAKDAKNAILDTQSVMVFVEADSLLPIISNLDESVNGLSDKIDDAEEAIVENTESISRFTQDTNGIKETLGTLNTKLYGYIGGNLLFQVTYNRLANDQTSLSAHVYEVDPDTRAYKEITNQFDDSCFSWSIRKVDIDEKIAIGKTITIENSIAGLDGNIDAWFYPYTFFPVVLTTRGKTKIYATRSGKALTLFNGG